MFRNYLTVALRNILRHRLYSAINIAGLAVGLITAADGHPEATAWADLIVQGILALGMAVAFFAIHRRHRGQHWTARWGWRRIAGRA